MILLSVLGGACGDEPVDTSGTIHVTILTKEPATFVAVREGDGDWRTLEFAGDGYGTDVREPYHYTVVCEHDNDSVDVFQGARSLDDVRLVELSCAAPDDDDELHQVTGTMAQEGLIGLGERSLALKAGDLAFDFTAKKGDHELVATAGGTDFNPDRIALRRIKVEGPTAVAEPIDIDRDGFALFAYPLAVEAGPGETLLAMITATTEHGTFAMLSRGEPAKAKAAPAVAFGEGDVQLVSVSAFADTATTSASRSVTLDIADAATLALPEGIGAPQFTPGAGGMTAGWSTLPAHDVVRLFVFGEKVGHRFEATARFIDATGATSVSIDTEIPGFAAAWKINHARERYLRSLEVSAELGREVRSSAQREMVNY